MLLNIEKKLKKTYSEFFFKRSESDEEPSDDSDAYAIRRIPITVVGDREEETSSGDEAESMTGSEFDIQEPIIDEEGSVADQTIISSSH